MYRDKLTLVGHSLGGGLATTASLIAGVPAMVFNSAGVHHKTVERYGGDLKRPPAQIISYQVAYNLADWQDADPLKFLGIHPWAKTVGTETFREDPDNTLKGHSEALKRHKIDYVIDLLGKQPL